MQVQARLTTSAPGQTRQCSNTPLFSIVTKDWPGACNSVWLVFARCSSIANVLTSINRIRARTLKLAWPGWTPSPPLPCILCLNIRWRNNINQQIKGTRKMGQKFAGPACNRVY
eukprot:5767784-Amphidinium_carterae.1